MNLSEYKVGNRVDVYVFEKKMSATVTKVSEEGVEVEIDDSFKLRQIIWTDYTLYLDPKTCIKKVLIKNAGIINRTKE